MIRRQCIQSAAVAGLVTLFLFGPQAPRPHAADAAPLPVSPTMPARATPSPNTEYLARVFRAADGGSMPYRLLIPRKYNPKKAYPLALFLHGDGERGTDNTLQLRNGGDLFLQPNYRRRYPAFVVFPQMPDSARWVDVPMDRTPTMHYPVAAAPSMRLAMGILASLEREFHIDPRRIYVLGVSDGGFGAWDAVIRYPGLFAAGVSAAGGADPAKAATVLHTPFWAFHGTADTVVYLPVEKNMVAALQSMGDRQLRYTEYPDLDHVEAFTTALKEPKLLPWLFTQHLPAAPPPRPRRSRRR